MNHLTFHVEREGSMPFDQREYALDVSYRVNPYYAATHLQPAEGGDCEIESVLLDGVEFDLTQAEEDRLQQACIDDANERAECAAEQRAEMREDDRMMDAWERGE